METIEQYIEAARERVAKMDLSDPLVKHDIILEIIDAMIYQNAESFIRLSTPITNRLIAHKTEIQSKGDI
jgi:hypothetical protein